MNHYHEFLEERGRARCTPTDGRSCFSGDDAGHRDMLAEVNARVEAMSAARAAAAAKATTSFVSMADPSSTSSWTWTSMAAGWLATAWNLVWAIIGFVFTLLFRLALLALFLFIVYKVSPFLPSIGSKIWRRIRRLWDYTQGFRQNIARLRRDVYYRVRYGGLFDWLYLRWQRFLNFFADHWPKLLVLAFAFMLAKSIWKANVSSDTARVVSLSDAAAMGYDVPAWAQSAAEERWSGQYSVDPVIVEDVPYTPTQVESSIGGWGALFTGGARVSSEALKHDFRDHDMASTASETITVTARETVTCTLHRNYTLHRTMTVHQKIQPSVFTLTETTTKTQLSIFANVTPTTMMYYSTVYLPHTKTLTLYDEKTVTETVTARPLYNGSNVSDAPPVYAEKTVTEVLTEGQRPHHSSTATVYPGRRFTEGQRFEQAHISKTTDQRPQQHQSAGSSMAWCRKCVQSHS